MMMLLKIGNPPHAKVNFKLSIWRRYIFDFFNTLNCADVYLFIECFDGDVLSAEYEIGTFSSIFTELTKLVSNVNNCILKNPLDVCNKCLPDFGQVNIAYNKLMGEKDICWDIKDAVSIILTTNLFLVASMTLENWGPTEYMRHCSFR